MELINGHEAEIKKEFSLSNVEYSIESHKRIFANEFHFNQVFFDNVTALIGEFGKSFDEKTQFMLVAYVDGEKAGSICGIGKENGAIQLRFFFLDSNTRGMGLGKKLFVRAMECCKEMGYSHIFFYTFNKLEIARTMYKKLGFVMTGCHDEEEIASGAKEEMWERDI